MLGFGKTGASRCDVLRLRDTYATPGGTTVAILGLTLAAAVVVRTAVTHLRAVRRQALRHARTARLVGRPEPAWERRWWTMRGRPPTASRARTRR